jgi:hypothetical protein
MNQAREPTILFTVCAHNSKSERDVRATKGTRPAG